MKNYGVFPLPVSLSVLFSASLPWKFRILRGFQDTEVDTLFMTKRRYMDCS